MFYQDQDLFVSFIRWICNYDKVLRVEWLVESRQLHEDCQGFLSVRILLTCVSLFIAAGEFEEGSKTNVPAEGLPIKSWLSISGCSWRISRF